jgi:L-lactate dehydrogenase complex protein LldG
MAMTPEQRARMREIVGAALDKAVLPDSARATPGHAGAEGGGGPAPPAPPVGPASVTLARDLASDVGPGAEKVARFRTELETLAGIVHTATTVDDIVAIVSRIADTQPTRSVLAWREAELGVPGLHQALEAAGLTLVDPLVDQSGPRREGQVAALAAASIGLTGADAALSLTGSIVIASGPGRPRLASLLTPVHVALVRTSTMVDSLPTLIARRPELVTRGSNFVCITGPSRTADIEHTLSRGVHGPGEVHVVLLD